MNNDIRSYNVGWPGPRVAEVKDLLEDLMEDVGADDRHGAASPVFTALTRAYAGVDDARRLLRGKQPRTRQYLEIDWAYINPATIDFWLEHDLKGRGDSSSLATFLKRLRDDLEGLIPPEKSHE